MKELSLNILDITENSVKAEASLVEITLNETTDKLEITIKDNGYGMKEDFLKSVTNPFSTTRTTRKVGMGIPLFKFAAEQTGGSFEISSKHIEEFPDSHGTLLVAEFNKNHIDFTPLGDVISTIITLIQGHPTVDFIYTHKKGESEVILSTPDIREVLEEIPLDNFEILAWIRENLTEQYGNF